MKKEIGIGIIGCGGRIQSLLSTLLPLDSRLKVTALCDLSRKSIKETQDLIGYAPKTYKKYQDLVKAPQVDWVIIGTWNCFHRDNVLAAFEEGKDVFCEKPLATNFEDSLAMYRAWKKSGRQFNIGFTLRFSPHYRKLKQLLNKGTIGDIISLEFNETLGFNHGGYIMGDWRRLTQNAGTHLLEKCSHDIDLANWMVESKASKVASFGGLNFFIPENIKHMRRIGKDKDGKPAYQSWPRPVGKNPFTSDKDIIDNQVAIIEYTNGVRATFHTNTNAGIPERRMYICGTEGSIRADVLTGKIEIQRIGFKTRIRSLQTGSSSGHGGGDVVLSKELAGSMLRDRPPTTGLEDGLKSAITCFAIDKAMETGKVVSVNPYWKKAGLI